MLAHSPESFFDSFDIVKKENSLLCNKLTSHFLRSIFESIGISISLLVLIPFVLVFFWFERGFVIFDDFFFLSLALHMSLIDISLNITNPSKEWNCDNVTYMLCILIGTLLDVCFKSIIKCLSFKFKVYETKKRQVVVGIYLC